MKKIVIMVIISFFCLLSHAEATTEYIVSKANSFLTSVLNGEYECESAKKNKTSDYFDGNYILLCKYKIDATNKMGYKNINLYYSLKNGTRGIYTVIYENYAVPRKLINKGTTSTITGSFVSESVAGSITNSTGFSNVIPNLKKKSGQYFVVETEEEIVKNLSNGECPYYAFESEEYRNVTQFAQGFTNNKDGTKYKANVDLKEKMNKAINSAKQKVGTLDTAREYDVNTLSLKSVNINTVAGALYQRVYSICNVNNNVNDLSNDELDELTKPAIDDSISKISKIYEDEWKLNLISTKNGLSDSEITKLSLPNLIKDGNKYKEGYNEIVDELHNIVQAACITDKYNITSNCEECPLGDEESCRAWTIKCNQINDSTNISENKDKNINESLFEEKKLVILNESEKPKGCDIFGESTTKLIKWAYSIIKYGAPILAIIMGILDFAKAFLSGEEKAFKESWQKFIKRVIAAVVVILLPILIVFILNLSGVLEQYGIEEGEIFCIIE